MSSVHQYDEGTFIAVDSIVSASVFGEVSYNKVKQDQQQFKFLFTRDVELLSIMEQCQSIMWSSTQAHAMSEYDAKSDYASD